MAKRLKIQFQSQQGNEKVLSTIAQASENETEEQAVERAKSILWGIFSKTDDAVTIEQFNELLTIEDIVL